MKFEQYNFQNIYIITTYRCNWKCDFCLFRFNKEKEASSGEILDRIEYSIKDSKDRVYLKITGGEPFLKKRLLEGIFKLSNKYKDKVYKIGIGTNGSIKLFDFFNDIQIRTDIFLSRHNLTDSLPTAHEINNKINNPLIQYRINCNLIKNSIDNLEKIEEYIIKKYKDGGIDHFCFRELNKIDIDENQMYHKQVYDYIEYYKRNLISISDIKKAIKSNSKFIKTRKSGNYYDTNDWYWYKYKEKKLSVKFRKIDEVKLIEFNKNNPSEIDEYVVHPDGTLTGCWDKEFKIIKEGGNYA